MRVATVTARCIAFSCRWKRNGAPYFGSLHIRLAGNTTCHNHSAAAFGYFRLRASGNRQHHSAILLTLAANRQLAALEVHVPDAQLETFLQPQAGAVQQGRSHMAPRSTGARPGELR
jgi:hypothetical protein